MNRVNWVDGRYTTPDDFNLMQTAPESHLRSHDKAALAGFIDGLTVSGSADGIQVAPGVAWDDQGRRIMVPAAASVDVSGIDRPASGHYKWLLISISYRQAERSTVRDSGGTDRPAYLDDSYTITATTGPEFAAPRKTDENPSNDPIWRARLETTNRPAIPHGAMGLALSVIDHDSGWDDLVSSPPRRGLTASRAVFVSTRNKSESDIQAMIEPLIPRIGDRVYGWGGLTVRYAQNGDEHDLDQAPVLFAEREPTRFGVSVVKRGNGAGATLQGSVWTHYFPSRVISMAIQAVFIR